VARPTVRGHTIVAGRTVDTETLKLFLIPLIAGVIGYATNWLAVKMLFFPVRFVGVRPPPLRYVVTFLPRRLKQIPGLMQGGIGWQGIIPSRAAKMGSISVDKGIAKLGSPSEFYERLDPESIAQHILATAREEIRDLVERILEREHPQLWRDLPPQVREAVHGRVQEELPGIVREVTDDIGNNIEHLMDVKLMVIRHIDENPELANRVFLEVGERELGFIVRSGLYFGFLLGLPQVPLFAAFGYWWILPVGGLVVGYLTNWIALRVIFSPVEPRKIGRFTLQGLFLRRQPEVAEVYGRLIADDVVTLRNMGDELLRGAQSDRTRRLIQARLRPAVDRGLGMTSPAVRVAVGRRQYDAIRESLAAEAVEYTVTPLRDPEFNRRQSDAVQALLVERMRELPPTDFAELLRSGMREDEWLLILLGAALGFLAGSGQIAFLF
jgi:uncharacterized membrane protein YheB (UPF0754 family)